MSETWWEVTPELRWAAGAQSGQAGRLQQKWVQKQFVRDEYVIAEEWRDVPMSSSEDKTP